ncbi:hypothetical protein EJB05_37392, partial [Eragrostis curvula]
METELKYARADGSEFPDSDDEDGGDLAGLVHHVVPYVETVGDVAVYSEAPGGDFVNLEDLPAQSSKMLIEVGDNGGEHVAAPYSGSADASLISLDGNT